MSPEDLLTNVADIVSAHVSNNAAATGDVAVLIQSVHATLAGLGAPVAPVEEPRSPAVSIRSSVKPEAVACLECGAKMKMLKRHLDRDHGLSPADYRLRWKLPADYPMVAPDYAAKRKDLAMKIGLGRKPKVEVAPTPAPEEPAAKKPVAKRQPTPAKAAPVKAEAPMVAAKPAAKPRAAPRKKLKLAFDGDPAAAPEAAAPAPAED